MKYPQGYIYSGHYPPHPPPPWGESKTFVKLENWEEFRGRIGKKENKEREGRKRGKGEKRGGIGEEKRGIGLIKRENILISLLFLMIAKKFAKNREKF